MSKRAPPPPPEVKRCAIYTRKSTTMGLEQEFNSLDAQRESCLSYIRRQQGWTLVDERYDDGGFTGKNIERPSFQRLLADIDARKVDVVVVYKVDRLSRSLLDFAKVMERLNAAGASFVSVTQNFSTADAMGRLTLNMLMSFAEFEREMIAERTRDKIAASRRKGKWTGGYTPFGYDKVEKKLVINEAEAHVVREAFSTYIEVRRMTSVAELLNTRKLYGRGTKKKPGKVGWTKVGITKLLRNPIYAGLISYGLERHPGEHKAIIDLATWELAERIGKERATSPMLRGLNDAFLLRGLLFCGVCGGHMTPASTRSRKVEHRYYRCSTRDKEGRKSCSVTALPAKAIEAYVVERIAVAVRERGLVEQVRSKVESRLRARAEEIARVQESLPKEITQQSARIGELVATMGTGEGKARELAQAAFQSESEKLAALEQRQRDLARDHQSLAGSQVELEWVASTLSEFSSVWGELSNANRARLLQALLKSVRVDQVSGEVEMEFYAPVTQEAA